MSEAIDDIEHAIERASDVLHDSRYWKDDGVYAAYITPALERLSAALTVATQRAETAEAAVEAVQEQRDYWAIAAHKLADAMKVDEALRKVDDAMVERAWKYLEIIAIEKSYGMLSGIDKEYLRNALTAALAVQPTTGEGA